MYKNLVIFGDVPVAVKASIGARKNELRKEGYTIPNYVIRICAHFVMMSHLGSMCFGLEQVNFFAKGKTTTSLIFRAVLKALGPTVNCPILTKESFYNNI